MFRFVCSGLIGLVLWCASAAFGCDGQNIDDRGDRFRIDLGNAVVDIMKPGSPGLSVECNTFWHEVRVPSGALLEMIFYVASVGNLKTYMEPTELSACSGSTVIGPLTISEMSTMANDTGVRNNLTAGEMQLLFEQFLTMGGTFMSFAQDPCSSLIFTFGDFRFIEDDPLPQSIAVHKTLLGNPPFFIGQTFFYKVAVVNESQTTVSNIRVTDHVPVEMDLESTFVSPLSLDVTILDRELQVELPPIPGGETLEFIVYGHAVTSGIFDNTLSVLAPPGVTVDLSDGVATTSIAAIETRECPGIQITASDRQTCEGGQTEELSVQISGGEPPYKVAWTPPDFIVDPTATTTLASPAETGYYTVTVTDSLGCTKSTIVTVYVDSLQDVIQSFGKETFPDIFDEDGDGRVGVTDMAFQINRCWSF